MTKCDNTIKKARSWKGYSEKNGKAQKYIVDPYNKKTKRHIDCRYVAWCALGISSLLMQTSIKKFSMSSSCKTQRSYFKKNKRWIDASKRPYKGLIIFVTGHEGIVEYTRADGSGRYWSGNCNNAWLPSSFNWKTGKAGKKKILGYGKPDYR